MSNEERRFDVIVVGAGLAGAAAATVLARSGWSVALVDRQQSTAPCFKAEKVEPDQADLLRELGLFAGVRPVLTPIRSIATAYRGRILQRISIEQYGTNYWELVDAVRAQLPDLVSLRIDRVQDVDLGPEHQRVALSDGSALEGRLVMLAGGTSPSLTRRLAILRRQVRSPHSFAFGFDIDLEQRPHDFDSLTYYSEDVSTRIDYLTLFPIGLRWRGNLFTYFDLDDPSVRRLPRDLAGEMDRSLPRLRSIIGTWTLASKVETQAIELYTAAEPARDGLIQLGDAHQSVCPATGTGLSKVLTDVKVACDLISGWLRTPGMDAAKLATYYRDPRKQTCDARSLEIAEHRRDFSTRTSLRWRIHRARTYLGMAVQSRPYRAAGQM